MIVSCAECNRKVTIDAKPCPHCGKPLGAEGRASADQAQPPSPAPQQKVEKDRLGSCLKIGVIVTVVLVIVVFWWIYVRETEIPRESMKHEKSRFTPQCATRVSGGLWECHLRGSPPDGVCVGDCVGRMDGAD